MNHELACPKCASTELATVEAVTGLASVSIERLANGGSEHHYSGGTEIRWDTSEAIGVLCRACRWEHIGAGYVDALVLGSPARDS